MATGVRSRQPFFASPELIAVLRELGEPQQYRVGTLLFTEGDAPRGIFLVESGSVSLSISGSREKKKCFSRVAGSGCVVGLPSTITDNPYSLTAKVLEDVQVLYVTNTALQECLRANPALCLDVLNMLAEEIRNIRAKQSQSRRRRRLFQRSE